MTIESNAKFPLSPLKHTTLLLAHTDTSLRKLSVHLLIFRNSNLRLEIKFMQQVQKYENDDIS